MNRLWVTAEVCTDDVRYLGVQYRLEYVEHDEVALQLGPHEGPDCGCSLHDLREALARIASMAGPEWAKNTMLHLEEFPKMRKEAEMLPDNVAEFIHEKMGNVLKSMFK